VQPTEVESSGRRGLILLLVAVCAEYLILSVSFDAQHWLDHVQLREQLGAIKFVGPALLAAIAGVFALGGSRWLKALSALAQARPERATQRALIAAHALSFGALYALSWYIYMPPFTADRYPGLWFTGWAALGMLTIGFLVAAFIDVVSIGRLLRQNAVLVGLAAVLTALAWQAGSLSSTFWDYTNGPVLKLLGAVASALFDGGFVDIPDRVLGTSVFAIEIAPACSGYEGIGLILVFLSGFLFMSRNHLRLPAALIVLPIGVVLVYVVNLVRIIALLAFGHYVSPTIAIAGFHAYAGWILFCAVALTLVYWTDHKFAIESGAPVEKIFDTATAAYLGPLIALIATSLITGLFAADIDHLYFARVAVAGLVLWLCRRYYAELRAVPSLLSLGIGVAIAVLWMFVVKAPQGGISPLQVELEALGPAARALWLIGRLLGFVIVVPIVEELAFRGYLLRRVQSPDFSGVPGKQWTAPAVLISSFLFGAIHADFIAGTLAGLLFAVAALHRGKLIDAIAAHAVANLVLAIIGLARGAYWLW
jgi:exosortase E/protease (VPEID-CTERM system)